MNRANEEAMVARFAKNLWWLRAQRKLSQESLAFRAEIHRTQVSLIEKGSRTPMVPTILALAGGLEVPVTNLFDGIEFRPPDGRQSGRYVIEPLIVPGIGEIP
jgi:transcriptional regulator with XRE-family HTH domain